VTRENPTTAEIRNWATYVPDTSIGMHVSERDAAAFDHWLATHDREVAAKALRDAAITLYADETAERGTTKALHHAIYAAWLLERAEATP
jgi:hypothetical protein